MRRIARRHERRWTLQNLVRAALRRDDDRRWHAIFALRLRGSPRTLALVASLCRSASWRRRELGCDIAAQLRRRHGAQYAVDETQALLLHGLRDARDEVARSAAAGAGHRPFDAALPELVRLSTHADAETRWSVACALGRYAQPAAIETLLRLARDVDADVRDWATFGLGTMSDTDTPEIRELLWRNHTDDNEDVRGEALVGLAKCRDPRAVDAVLRALTGQVRVYALEAAKELANPSLLEPLLALRPTIEDDVSTYWLGRLDAAIAACTSAEGASTP